jgi:hypothetical protein
VTPRAAWYLAIEGHGAPRGDAFDARLDALRLAARTLRAVARRHGILHPAARLEAQWWAVGRDGAFPEAPTELWRWRLLLTVPDAVTAGILREAGERLALARPRHPLVAEVELVQLDEGPCVQQLQLGPVEAEPHPAAEMRAFAEAEGLRLDGRHHEIYLTDPRRVPPERQRVILRQPITPRRDRIGRPLGRAPHAA